jgi:hypothetical protein
MSARQMADFDRLPRELREYLAAADFNWNARDALAALAWGMSPAQVRALLDREAAKKHAADAAQGVICPQPGLFRGPQGYVGRGKRH